MVMTTKGAGRVVSSIGEVIEIPCDYGKKTHSQATNNGSASGETQQNSGEG